MSIIYKELEKVPKKPVAIVVLGKNGQKPRRWHADGEGIQTVGFPQAVNGIPQTSRNAVTACHRVLAVTYGITMSSDEFRDEHGTRHARCFNRRRKQNQPSPPALSHPVVPDRQERGVLDGKPSPPAPLPQACEGSFGKA